MLAGSAMITLQLLFVAVAVIPSDGQSHLWVSPTDSGALERAVAAAAAASSATTVHLLPGRHALARPLQMGASLSGARFVGHSQPAVSGGALVRGWEVAGPAHCASCSEVWRARTPPGVDSRQLYLLQGIKQGETDRGFRRFT